MTVDIGDGRSDTVTVKEDDSYVDLAKQFQEKHGLIPGVVEPLAEHIKFNVEKVLKEQAQALNKTSNMQKSFGSNMYSRSPATKQDKKVSIEMPSN